MDSFSRMTSFYSFFTFSWTLGIKPILFVLFHQRKKGKKALEWKYSSASVGLNNLWNIAFVNFTIYAFFNIIWIMHYLKLLLSKAWSIWKIISRYLETTIVRLLKEVCNRFKSELDWNLLILLIFHP
jgi:hypothetical protein